MVPGRLQDKVAVITCAGSIGPGWGNGKATSVLFAREGAKVVCVDRNSDAAEETKDLIEAEGGVALAVTCDVSKKDQVDAMAKAVFDRFGRIDILHNNVGIAVVGGPVEIEEDVWDRVSDVNLKSLYLVCKAVLPIMEAGGGGGHCQHILDRRYPVYRGRLHHLLDHQGGDHPIQPVDRAAVCQEGHPVELHSSRSDGYTNDLCRIAGRLFGRRYGPYEGDSRGPVPDRENGRRLGRGACGLVSGVR